MSVPAPRTRAVVWLRRSAWLVLGLLALVLLLWLGVPPLLKSQAEQRAGAALGRTVTIAAVEFKPWSLELTLRDLVIGAAATAPAGAPPLLRVNRLYVDADARSLWQRAPVLQALEIDQPQVNVARTAPGHYDIDDLIERLRPAPNAPPASEAPRFALYNLRVRDASLRFDDRPLQRRHEVQALQLALPFISNLPAEVEVKVLPRLAFRVNGTAFDSGAEATPFAQKRSASLQFRMAPLDLQPYLAYLPAALPLRLLRGQIDADLALDFTQPAGATPQVALRGKIGAAGIALAAAGSGAGAEPLLEWKRLALELRDVQPLLRRLDFGTLKVDAPLLRAARDANGRIDVLMLGDPATAASAPRSEPAAPTAPWQVRLGALEVNALRLHWRDAAVKPAAALVLGDLSLTSGPLAWPLAAAVPVKLSARLDADDGGARAADASLGRIEIDARVDARAGAAPTAVLDLKLDGLALQALAPYFATQLTPTVDGALSLAGHAEVAVTDGVPQLTLRDGRLTVDALRVVEAAAAPARGARAAKAAPAFALKQLVLDGITLDLAARRIGIASLKLVQPAAGVARDAQGRWNVERWPVAASAPRAAQPPPVKASSADKPLPPWRVELRELALDGGQLRFSDAFAGNVAVTEPVRFELSALRLSLQNLVLTGARTAAPVALRLSAKLGAAATERAAAASATLDWRGQVGVQPLSARGKLSLVRFPVHLFEPYFGQRLKLSLQRAEVGTQAELSLQETAAGLQLKLAGDVLLADVKVDAKPDPGGDDGDQLLAWQAFTLKGVQVALMPGQRPSIAVAEAALNDFYSRLVITEQGRFNQQDVAPADPAAAAPAAESASASAASAAASAAVASAPIGPDISIGATRLTNGRVDFTDRFVRPNYSAKLTELNGSLGAFRSGTREMATLELRGRAAGTALLDISGQLNPTADPLALDIRARATDLELAPLSPYAGKYAGYAIERGKLSMDVSYKISPDGTLEAKNQVILNQLTFGEKIDSPTATKLPVLFAVALLKDRNGVIDINLPVSGSVNDPKFSVGAIIWKVILNLIGRALTAPFSLLAGGAGDDLSSVEFGAGTANLAASGTAALDKVAKALTDRPSLKMTVTGAADPQSEREAFQQAALDARLLAERRKELARGGATTEAVDATTTVAGEDRLRVLKEVYRQTSLPDKPRNLIGMAKDIAPAEMERLLKTRLLPSVDAMRELALQRGLAVRDALIARGLPSERLFIAAPKLRASGEEDAAWKPTVQLTLSAN